MPDDWPHFNFLPRDLYELIGVKRFEPDRETLLGTSRAVVCKLMQDERRAATGVARRATRLQRETATADQTLRKRRRRHNRLRWQVIGRFDADSLKRAGRGIRFNLGMPTKIDRDDIQRRLGAERWVRLGRLASWT